MQFHDGDLSCFHQRASPDMDEDLLYRACLGSLSTIHWRRGIGSDRSVNRGQYMACSTREGRTRVRLKSVKRGSVAQTQNLSGAIIIPYANNVIVLVAADVCFGLA